MTVVQIIAAVGMGAASIAHGTLAGLWVGTLQETRQLYDPGYLLGDAWGWLILNAVYAVGYAALCWFVWSA